MDRTEAMAEETEAVIPEVFTFSFGRRASARLL